MVDASFLCDGTAVFGRVMQKRPHVTKLRKL